VPSASRRPPTRFSVLLSARQPARRLQSCSGDAAARGRNPLRGCSCFNGSPQGGYTAARYAWPELRAEPSSARGESAGSLPSRSPARSRRAERRMIPSAPDDRTPGRSRLQLVDPAACLPSACGAISSFTAGRPSGPPQLVCGHRCKPLPMAPAGSVNGRDRVCIRGGRAPPGRHRRVRGSGPLDAHRDPYTCAMWAPSLSRARRCRLVLSRRRRRTRAPAAPVVSAAVGSSGDDGVGDLPPTRPMRPTQGMRAIVRSARTLRGVYSTWFEAGV